HLLSVKTTQAGASGHLRRHWRKNPASHAGAHQVMELAPELREIVPHAARVRSWRFGKDLSDGIDHEIFFRGPPTIDRGLPHRGPGSDPLNAHGGEPFLDEKIRRRIQDGPVGPRAGGPARSRDGRRGFARRGCRPAHRRLNAIQNRLVSKLTLMRLAHLSYDTQRSRLVLPVGTVN